ncbi:hypothetical protein A0H81_03675 [Grifola frondosa]|uniref:Uncharacterized protein n=1 Tax=Grifola frondosa TaxID=5627 RepID=A0A1C7MKJ9_GRIFR|nr:hypothetical protein A0H81_03675 [Grifola frondosa]
MPLFGRRSDLRESTSSTRRRIPGLHFHRKDQDRVAGGYKAALSNPNTTRSGRKHAKHELRAMGRGRETHVSLLTKVKRTLGIRSTPRSEREHRSALSKRR